MELGLTEYLGLEMVVGTLFCLPIQETQEMQVRSLSREDALEKGTATHSSILAWRIPMDRGAWQGYCLCSHKVSDMTEQLIHSF